MGQYGMQGKRECDNTEPTKITEREKNKNKTKTYF